MEIKEKSISRRAVLLITSAIFLIIALVFTVISIAIGQRSQDKGAISSEQEEGSLMEISSSEESQDLFDDSGLPDASQTFAESESSEESVVTEASSVPDEDELSHGWIINKYGYTYLYGDSGFEQFNYSTLTMNRYAESLNTLSSVVPEDTDLYNITVPVSATFVSIPREIYVEDNFYNKSQSAFVSTVETKLNDSIKNIPIIAKIEEQYNNGEYIFFRTDKNWTALGAYTAYTAFCESAGIHAYSLSNFPEIEVGDYLGRFYLATEAFAMENNPDDMICYSTIPSVKTSLIVYDYGTVYTDFSLCGNNVTLDDAYNVYLGKTAGRYEINTTVEGGNLLIIGDSSAYPMIPFLASHYSKIDMIDPQYYDESLITFLSEHQYDDIITMCYSTNATSGDYVPAFNTLTGVNTNDE